MKRVAVVSTDIAEIGYDSNNMTLEVAFHAGSVYQYFNVSATLHQQFMNASSKGKFLNANIKNKYRYAKV